MKIIDGGGKKFKLPRLLPVAGRELFTKGLGVTGLFDQPMEYQLKFFGHVQVHILDEIWVPLSTEAMLDNHVPKAAQPALLLKFLEYNCPQAKELINSPSLADALWEGVINFFEEAVANVAA
jgi:hypothetical protein